MKATKIVITQRFDGVPKLSDFKVVEETLPSLQDGEILCKAEWLSVDPYMRAFVDRLGIKVGENMPGPQVARVIQSKSPEHPEGSQVVGHFGWRDLTIVKAVPVAEQNFYSYYKMPEMKGLSDSYAVGCMGMPGVTAYFGLTRVGKPKANGTLVVSAAAGAVGSLVGQIGKSLGMKVIGYTGTDEKVNWLRDLGFDFAFNYKTESVPETLKENAPEGVDVYFDNVGGQISYDVTCAMKPFGRIVLCGAISNYNQQEAKVPFSYISMIYNDISMEGFLVSRFLGEWMQGIDQIRDLILEEKLTIKETRYFGLDQMPQAFMDLFDGKNTGKVVIRL